MLYILIGLRRNKAKNLYSLDMGKGALHQLPLNILLDINLVFWCAMGFVTKLCMCLLLISTALKIK